MPYKDSPRLTDLPTTPKKKKKHLATAIRIVVSVGLLMFLFYKMGPTKIFDAIRGANPVYVLAIFGLMFTEHLHGTYKWMILLRHTASNVPFWPMLRVRYLSSFIGTFGLGAVTIELVRMYGLARYTNDLAMSFTSILMDRLLGLTGLSLMILIGVVMQSRETVAGIEFWAGGAMALILAGWIAIMNRRFRTFTDKTLAHVQSWIGNHQHQPADHDEPLDAHPTVWVRTGRAVARLLFKILAAIRDKQKKVYQSLDAYRGRPGLLTWAMVQSLIFNVLRILVVWTGALAIGIDVPIGAFFVATPIVIFAMLIPISMSGWGVRESMFVYLLVGLYGAQEETVLAMSLLIGVCAVLSTLPGAVLLMTGMGAPKPNDAAPAPSEQT